MKNVRSDNDNYPQALMGIGWCYLKLFQFQNVISPLEKFINYYPDHYLIPEVYLLLGQAHLKIRLYDKAMNYFNELLNMFPETFDNTTINSQIEPVLKSFKKNVENQRLNLLLIETELLDTFQLISKKWVPKFMLDEVDKIKDRSSNLIDQINTEKNKINDMLETVDQLKLKLEVRTRDWRTYAEYGISRALYLKGQSR